MKERTKFLLMVVIFLIAYFVPFDHPRLRKSAFEAFIMLKEYAQHHVLTCLVPAFFIAGAIGCFISQAAVMKYFGAKAKKILAYSVASVSGSVLAVCSCTVLPLFAGIYKRGAGIGPATAFLYSGPAINVLAIILTGRVLGIEIGIARAVGAIVFSVVIGLLMALIFRKEEKARVDAVIPEAEKAERPLWKTGVYLLLLVLFLIFAAWGKPKESVGFANFIYSIHWFVALVFIIILLPIVHFWFKKDEQKEWGSATWGFAKQIFPLLFIGVVVAGLLYGLLPQKYVQMAVGGNSIRANFFASIVGAFMYFATLTEVPIVQGLMKLGMGKGPALALLLSGPALSLPNMLVIRSVLGTKKTICYIVLVITMSTISGLIFGNFFG